MWVRPAQRSTSGAGLKASLTGIQA
jgi:hypothetical protein